MSTLTNSLELLSKYKARNGIRADGTTSASEYIAESKLKKKLKKWLEDYSNQKLLLSKYIITPHRAEILSTHSRLNKMNVPQFNRLIENEGIEAAVKKMFNLQIKFIQ